MIKLNPVYSDLAHDLTMLIDVVALSKLHCDMPIKAKLKYATTKNFVGSVISGYDPSAHDFALLTPKAARALCQVQSYLLENYHLGLLIYDSYRPKRAVNHFLMWTKDRTTTETELVRKSKHYPSVEKDKLFELGYLAEDSNHCYGNTVDLVLIDEQGKKLDMGTRFDYMDIKSHTTATASDIGETAVRNRHTLRDAMVQFGFEPYPEEYWHFTHGGVAGREVQDPLDIVITPDMKGIVDEDDSEKPSDQTQLS